MFEILRQNIDTFGLQICLKLTFKITLTKPDILRNVNVQIATVCTFSRLQISVHLQNEFQLICGWSGQKLSVQWMMLTQTAQKLVLTSLAKQATAAKSLLFLYIYCCIGREPHFCPDLPLGFLTSFVQLLNPIPLRKSASQSLDRVRG